MSETRVDLRAHVNIPIQLLGSDSRSPRVAMETINISAGGAYCRVPEHVSLRSQIRVRIDLPSGEDVKPIVTDAIVLRVISEEAGREGFVVALYFLNLSFEDRHQLQEFVFGHITSESSTR
ncbi:MAG: PilZ domain-containing protein [Acidobacteriota bacterium]